MLRKWAPSSQVDLSTGILEFDQADGTESLQELNCCVTKHMVGVTSTNSVLVEASARTEHPNDSIASKCCPSRNVRNHAMVPTEEGSICMSSMEPIAPEVMASIVKAILVKALYLQDACAVQVLVG